MHRLFKSFLSRFVIVPNGVGAYLQANDANKYRIVVSLKSDIAGCSNTAAHSRILSREHLGNEKDVGVSGLMLYVIRANGIFPGSGLKLVSNRSLRQSLLRVNKGFRIPQNCGAIWVQVF